MWDGVVGVEGVLVMTMTLGPRPWGCEKVDQEGGWAIHLSSHLHTLSLQIDPRGTFTLTTKPRGICTIAPSPRLTAWLSRSNSCKSIAACSCSFFFRSSASFWAISPSRRASFFFSSFSLRRRLKASMPASRAAARAVLVFPPPRRSHHDTNSPTSMVPELSAST